jgi:CBS domain containing-hemolysin-like protein
MQPRADVVYLDIEQSIHKNLDIVSDSRHSRYPVCQGSLDRILGVVHIKDFVGRSYDINFDLRSILRPPQFVPETIPVSRLLRQFQSSHQHMAFAVDEYGVTVGVVTLEDVIEQIVGEVEDEFDQVLPQITSESDKSFVVLGRTPVETVNRVLNLTLDTGMADTFSGFLMTLSAKVPAKGDHIHLPGAVAEILDVVNRRAGQVRLTIVNSNHAIETNDNKSKQSY